MSDKLDQRIVEMSFENQKFEKGISQSQNSLKEFSNALKNADTGKDFSGLEKSVGSLSGSFSMLEQIGIGALRRIGESAINAGSRLIKSLTIDPAIAGLTKYEQKTASVQNIMNATGKSIGEVNGYLDQLMWFSDETSYGFTDMTAALAQMTSSGGNIETLIPMITGVANATAFAGKGAAEFSRAMFNLNQSYGAGSLQNMDWKSLELAGVAGKDLKQVFIDTGKELGTLSKKGKTAKGTLVDIGNFSASLKEKWANTKVMEKAFGKFSELSQAAYKLVSEGKFDTAAEAMESLAGKYSMIAEKGFAAAQTAKTFNEAISATMDAVSSGWMRTYELMFGDLNEAKKNFTALTEILWTVFASGAENRNEMLAWLKEFGGISNVFQGIKNVAISLLTILKPVSQAFDQIFPPRTKEQWLALTEAFKNFTAGLIIADSTGDKIKRTFAGLFAVIDIGWQVVKFLGNAAFELVKIFLPLGSGILDTSASLGDLLVNVAKAIKSSSVFQYGLLAVKIGVALLRAGLAQIISVVAEFVTGLWNADDPLEYLKNIGSKVFSGLLEGIKMVVTWLSGKFTKAITIVSGLFNGLFGESTVGIWPTILEVLKEVIAFISGKAVDGFKNFGDVIKNLDFNKIATFVVGGVLLIFIKQLSDLTGAMAGFTNSLTGAIGGFTKKFLKMPTTSLIRDLAFAFGILAASIWLLSRIPAADLNRSLIGLAAAIGIFVVAYGLLQGINVAASKLMNDKAMVTSAFGLTGVAAALLIMAVAVNTISKIDEKQVWNSTLVLGAMLGFLTAYQVLSALISKIPNQQKISMNLFGMSASILVLVGALGLLNLFTRSDLIASLGKMASILLVIAGLEGVFALAARLSGGNKVAISVLGMAVGIAAMVAVIKLLSVIDSRTITQSIGNLALIALLIAGVEVMMGLAGRIGGGKKFQFNILSTTIGMLAMIGLVAILGNMKTTTIDQGMINVAKIAIIISGIELLTALSARIAGGAKVQNILGSVTISILAFTGVIVLLGSIPLPIIDQGILTLTKMVGFIAAIELVTAVASKISGDTKMFTSLIGVAIAIVALTGSLALLSMVDQGFLREAAVSLAIASVAIIAISFAMNNISSAVSLMSKGSKSFIDNVKSIGITLIALGALLIATAAFFVVLNGVLPIIEATSWDSLGKFIVGLGAITALVVALNLIPLNKGDAIERLRSLIPGLVVAELTILATAGLFVALGWVLPIVEAVKPESLAKFLIALVVVSAIVGGIALLNKSFIALGAGGFTALAGIVIAIVGMAAVVLATVGLALLLNKLLPSADNLIRGLDLLVLVGAGIGRFIGSIVGGLAGGVLEGIGISIASFAKTLDGVTFSPKALQSIKSLAEAVLIITGAAILEGIGSFITGTSSMEVFGKQLSGLVTAINKISSQSASAASTTLAAMKPMVDNLIAFTTAAKSIPPTGGWFGAVVGDNDIDDFGIMIGRFINVFNPANQFPITAASIFIATTTLAALKPMAANLIIFADAAEHIPNSGGLLGGLVGEDDVDKFGKMIGLFINVFNPNNAIPVTAANATIAVNVLAALKPMATNLIDFADAAEHIPNSGGWLGGIVGDNNIDDFGLKLAALIGIFGTVDKTQLGLAISNLQSMNTNMLPNLKAFSEFTISLDLSKGFALSTFGGDLRGFIDQLSGADLSIVAPAMAAMEIITKSFTTLGANVLASAKLSFENNKEPFQKSVASILAEPTTKLAEQKLAFVEIIASVFKAVTDKGASYVQEFKTLGENIVNGLKAGIESKKPAAINIIKSVMTSIVTGAQNTVNAHSPSKVFETIGSWCTLGLANGIAKETKVAVQAGINMSKATEGAVRDTLGVHSLSSIWASIGQYLPKSLGTGIQNGQNWLLSIASQLGIDTGNLTVEGIISSVAGGDSQVTTVIESLLGILKAPAEVAGTDAGDSLNSGFNKSLSNGTTGIGGSKNKGTVKTELDKLKEAFDKSKNWIENEKFYGRLSLDEELAAWQRVQKTYAKGTEQRMAADREVYTVLNTIYDAQISYIDGVSKAQADAVNERSDLANEYTDNVNKANADAVKKLADLDEKYADDKADAIADADKKKSDADKKYNEDVTTKKEQGIKDLANLQKKYDEDAVSAQVTADKKKLDEDKKYADSLTSILDKAEAERQKSRDQYATDQTSINSKLLSDIDAQNKAYESAVKSRANAIYNSYSLFAAVDPDVAVTGDQLLKNLQDQSAALSEWKQSLADLAGRGVGDAMIEELQAMGPASKAQLNALLTLTDEQLIEYVDLFESKYAFARVAAEGELEGLKNNTALAIQGLNAQAAIDLTVLETEFTNSMATINSNMVTSMTDLRTTHNETMTGIELDLTTQLTKLKDDWTLAEAEIQTNMATALADLYTTHNEALTEISADLAIKLSEMEIIWKKSSNQIATDLSEKLDEMRVTYNKSLATINAKLKTDLETMEKTFSTTMKSVNGLTETELLELIATNKKKLTELNLDTAEKLDDVKTTFDKNSTDIVSSFGSTLQNLIPNTILTLNTLIPAIKSSFDSVNAAFETAGINAAAGFAAGIRDASYLAVSAASYLARTAVSAAESILKEKSPSKVFEGIGKFVSMGFANGIVDYAYQAEKASEEMARGPIAAVSQALADLEDSDYLSFTITPVIDLSAIRSSDISQLLNTPIRLGTASGKLAVETVQNGSRETIQTTPIGTTNTPNGQSAQGAVISLTQNNYSPLALSRLEIYRQTKNQLSAMKGLVVGT